MKKNDIVYSPLNKQHYYWSGENAGIGKSPVEAQSSWSRERAGILKMLILNTGLESFFGNPLLV